MNDLINKTIKNKTILITGGTGSFGQSVVNTLLNLDVGRIIIFSRDEKKQFDMRNKFDNPRLKFVIGDVRDRDSLNSSMGGVNYVFHAAALKQVPTCEFFPLEAVKTNILGTSNVILSAIEAKVEKVVFLSTDKAVYPINAVGISKAMMEKIMIAESKKYDKYSNISTILCGVRYGNVLYTRGSVLPYFVSLIKQNKKISITDPKMTRFLLPLPDAVSLVFYALTNGERGYVYVKKSPACNIETLAKSLCRIFDYKTGIFETGIRAGEKMHETLVTEEERLRAVENREYFKIPPESQGLDYNKYFYRGKSVGKSKIEPYTSENTKQLDVNETTKLLLELDEIKQELKGIKQKPL
ncbi:MAG: polysaccharide biosynthesis protein [Patescibacteria group bacterium]